MSPPIIQILDISHFRWKKPTIYALIPLWVAYAFSYLSYTRGEPQDEDVFFVSSHESKA